MNSATVSQLQAILERLQYGPTSSIDFREMGIMHPAGSVETLRKQGYEIVTEWVTEYCSGGVRHRVARYSLQPEE